MNTALVWAFSALAGIGLTLVVLSLLPRRNPLLEALRRREETPATTPRKALRLSLRRGGRNNPDRENKDTGNPGTADPWADRIRLAGFEDSIGTGRRLMLYSLGAAVVILLLAVGLTHNVLAALLGAGLVFAGPFMLIDRLAAQKAARMERQVPAFIDAVGAVLPNEGNVQQAILRIAMVTPEPLGPEILTSLKAMAIHNITLAEAVARAGEASHSPALKSFAEAVYVAEREQGASADRESSVATVILTMAARLREREAKVIARRRELTTPMGMYNLFLAVTLGAFVYSVLRPNTVHIMMTTTLGHYVLGTALLVIPGTYVLMRMMTSTSDITAKKKGA